MNYNVPGVKSGYEGPRSDLYIPSCGIEDVDVALFELFDKEIQASVSGSDATGDKKVPVIFAAGEKWALLKKGKPIRDRNNTLILPLITIMRSQIAQSNSEDIAGRGINQQTGEIVVRRRLDSSDRDYQNLINKLMITNQNTAAISTNTVLQDVNSVTVDRKVGDLSNNNFVRRGGLLQSTRKNNIFETIVVPSPQFYTATYEINVWAQYMQHMNQIIEKITSSYLPQAQSWKITTQKGYWFVATVEEGRFETETNFDDMSTAERFIKIKFTVKVPAYIWASSAPGVPIPVKRYVSSPIIDFQIGTTRAATDNQNNKNEVNNSLILGSDDPTLPLDNQPNARDDQRRPGWKNNVIQPTNSIDVVDDNDPALSSLPRGLSAQKYRKVDVGGGQFVYAKIVNENASTGETVYSAADLDALQLVPID